MPVVSQAQWNLMQGIRHGWRPTRRKGKAPSRAVAEEFVKHGKPRGLPKRKRRRGTLLTGRR